MIKGLIFATWKIHNYQRIPKMPRGMYAGEYNRLGRDNARILARMGARCPRGVEVAMKRANVGTVAELVEKLQHYRARHRFLERLDRMIGRFFGAEDTPPHADAITRAGRGRRRIDPNAREQLEIVISEFCSSKP